MILRISIKSISVGFIELIYFGRLSGLACLIIDVSQLNNSWIVNINNYLVLTLPISNEYVLPAKSSIYSIEHHSELWFTMFRCSLFSRCFSSEKCQCFDAIFTEVFFLAYWGWITSRMNRRSNRFLEIFKNYLMELLPFKKMCVQLNLISI